MDTETKNCQNCKKAFVIESSDFQFYERMQVPPPTWCPNCRAMRRMSFWNEHNLYRKKEALKGKEIFSTYPEESDIKIYDHDYWWSDAWDPMEYGKEYDFSRPFFEQFRELMYAVPEPSRETKGLVNSDYCNNAGHVKNCYLCFDCDNSEDCMYGVGFRNSKNVIDFAQGSNLELSYELFSTARMFQCFFTIESSNCRNIWFSRDCVDCTDCFGCVNLRHKKYHIFNVPYTKEEYKKKLKEFNLGSYSALLEVKKRVKDFWKTYPYKYMHGTRNENAVGDYIYHAKNIRYCYQVSTSENIRYSQNVVNQVKDAYDFTSWGDFCELFYEAVVSGYKCRNLKFCIHCWPGCEDLEYSINCHSSTNLFGCVGLEKKSYCIFNKQYSKEEYEKLVSKIREHMNEMPFTDDKGRIYRYGEFFPPEFSPLAYNETAAIDHFPLEKEDAENQGFTWREPHPREFETTMKSDTLPDHIDEVDFEVCKEVLECKTCKRAYRILERELEFYKRFMISLPRLCYGCRYKERISQRSRLQWYKRGCMCGGKKSATGDYTNIAEEHSAHDPNQECPNTFETSYAPDRKEIIYCEPCYQEEVA